MKAVVARAFGGPDVVSLTDMPDPLVGPKDVLVDVRAASLNPVDAKIRAGALKLVLRQARPLLILGCDVAGVVRGVGSSVTRFSVGDEVYGRLEKNRMGGLAERVAADESVLAKKPASIGFDEAAALPLVALTAVQCLREAGARAGQRALIHAAAGGVGSVAVQIAKILGLHVIATASAGNHAFVRELGADEVIDYKSEAANARGLVDVVLDGLGDDSEIASSLPACTRGGIVVGINGAPDVAFARASMPAFTVPAVWWLSRKRTRAFAAAGVRYAFVFMRPDGAQLEEVAAWVDGGRLRPVIHQRFGLNEFAVAFAELERGRARGKIVVTLV